MITITALYDEQRPSINLVTDDVGGAIAARAAAQEALDRQHAAETAALAAQASSSTALDRQYAAESAAATATSNAQTATQQAAIATQASVNTQVAIVEVATNLVTMQAIVATLVNK